MFKLIAAVGAAVFFSASAQAATLNSYSSASSFALPATSSTEDSDILKDVNSAVVSAISTSATSTSGSTTTTSNTYVNGDTGVMRGYSFASGVRGDGLGDGNTSTESSMSENYFVTGTGTITASLKLDGIWDLTRVDLNPNDGITPLPFWQVQSDIRIGLARDFICLGTSCGPSLNSNNSGSITDYILSVTTNFSSLQGANVNVSSSLLTQILTGNGFIDFGNTAKMLVEFSDGLTATPSDPDFLSNPAFFDDTMAVPLPQSVFLLASGFVVLIGRRKKLSKTAA